MEQYVGLDVSQKLTHICVVDSQGKPMWQGKCPSSVGANAETLHQRAPQAVRIGFESGPLSAWHYYGLKDLGFPAICIDARHAKSALSVQINKTDKNDARGIAELMRMGWYRAVAVKSFESHTIHAMLGVRFQLV